MFSNKTPLQLSHKYKRMTLITFQQALINNILVTNIIDQMILMTTVRQYHRRAPTYTSLHVMTHMPHYYKCVSMYDRNESVIPLSVVSSGGYCATHLMYCRCSRLISGNKIFRDKVMD